MLVDQERERRGEDFVTLRGFAFGFASAFGYVLDIGTGNFTAVNHPDALFGTIPLGINDVGQVVGYYADADFTPHCFLATPSP